MVEIQMHPMVLGRIVALSFPMLDICTRDCFPHLPHPYEFSDLLDKTELVSQHDSCLCESLRSVNNDLSCKGKIN